MVANDLSIYSEYADEWWNPRAPRFHSLQRITPLRLAVIEEWCGNLEGKTVADIGCGGGLIAVPLLERGAHVIGIDLSAKSLVVAQNKALRRGRFMVADACTVPLANESVDLVVLADVLDHVPDFERAIAEAARLIKPGGYVFTNTLNRTFRSWLLALVLGEGLRLIPPGTHDYRLFIRPAELIAAAERHGLRLIHSQGEFPKVIDTLLHWSIGLKRSSSMSVMYSMCFCRAAGV